MSTKSKSAVKSASKSAVNSAVKLTERQRDLLLRFNEASEEHFAQMGRDAITAQSLFDHGLLIVTDEDDQTGAKSYVINDAGRAVAHEYRIVPADFGPDLTSRHDFMGVFRNMETEISASWLINFAMERAIEPAIEPAMVRGCEWEPFTDKEIKIYYQKHLQIKEAFLFNKLIPNGFIAEEKTADGTTYHFTPQFIKTAFAGLQRNKAKKAESDAA